MTADIFVFEKRLEGLERKHLHGGNEPPYDGGMEARVTKLEAAAQDTRERLVRIETRLEHIDGKINTEMVTKDSMKAAIAEAKNSIIMWVVSAILLAQLLPSLLKKFGL